ncbi:MAG: non-canonical purine NTP pyrophosphatase, partial [Clostridia bacterium]|nr:non-canonical purine NTP pyrophosphatase [Clostridia bacterium]
MELILASRNKKKIREMEDILATHFPGIHILSLDDIGFEGDIEEDGTTFEE